MVPTTSEMAPRAARCPGRTGWSPAGALPGRSLRGLGHSLGLEGEEIRACGGTPAVTDHRSVPPAAVGCCLLAALHRLVDHGLPGRGEALHDLGGAVHDAHGAADRLDRQLAGPHRVFDRFGDPREDAGRGGALGVLALQELDVVQHLIRPLVAQRLERRRMRCLRESFMAPHFPSSVPRLTDCASSTTRRRVR